MMRKLFFRLRFSRIVLSVFILALITTTGFSQNPWRKNTDTIATSGHYAVYDLDFSVFQNRLSVAPREGSRVMGAAVSIPKPDGELITFQFEETVLFTSVNPALLQIKTYTGRTSDGLLVIHLTVENNSIQGIVTGANETWFIATPKLITPDRRVIEVYDLQGRPFADKAGICGAGEGFAGLSGPGNRESITNQTPSVSCAVKTYRLAVAGTADYTAFFGSQSAAFSNTVALVNNLNAIYERDMGVRFVLATGQNLMYTDAAADPFNNSSTDPCQEISISRANFVSQVGVANYDLGITVYGLNFGGCAYVGATCSNNNKGGAVGGYSSPTSTSYLLEVCAHEIGHLFGAGHTHNGTGGTSCAITPTSSWEPGGGSTIMAYTSCNPSFTSYNTSLYFHGGSLGQMRSYIASFGSCFYTGEANTSPTLTAQTDGTFYIPVSTPYRLFSQATDAEDANSLTYTFDQVDLGTGTTTPPSSTTASGPMVRSFEPSTKNYRYVPRIDSIVAGINPAFESVPSVNRNLTFWATVRDNRPGCGCQSVDTISIATSGSTPFRVNSQGTATTVTAGSSVTVTWDPAGTTAAPFNVSNVQILFAGDGLNYNAVLAASTPNDGSQQVTIPNITTTGGRIMIAAIGNIFFDINDANITVSTSCSDVQRNQIFPETSLRALAGSSDLQLSQTVAFGAGSDGINSEITSADPTGILGFRNSSTDATCRQGSGYTGRYEILPFYTVTPGAYTISRTPGTLTGSLFFSLYSAGGYSATNVCNNYLYSNVWFNGTGSNVSFVSAFTYNLLRNTSYAAAFEVYSSTLFGTYRLNITGPGPIFTEYKNPANNFSYVVVNSSNTIVSVTAASPDLRSFPVGTYYVYGVSSSTSLNLASYQGQSFDTLLYGNFSSGGCVSVSNNRREIVVSQVTALPLTFVKLTALPVAKAVQLDWTVSDEADAAEAVIEHSVNGISFTALATLRAGEGKVAPGEFRYDHKTPSPGRNYYRIKQSAQNGKLIYSNTVSVTFSGKPYVSVSPNPTSGKLTVTAGGREQFVPFTISVFDSRGRLVRAQKIERQVSQIDLTGLPAGLYLLHGEGINEKILKR